jgi:hypothetical protein
MVEFGVSCDHWRTALRLLLVQAFPLKTARVNVFAIDCQFTLHTFK